MYTGAETEGGLTAGQQLDYCSNLGEIGEELRQGNLIVIKNS